MAWLVPRVCAALTVSGLIVHVLCGCGADNGSAPAPVDITGTWQQVGGPCFGATDGADIAESGLTLFLDFGDTQKAGRHLRDPENGLVDCLGALYTFTTDGLLLFSAEPRHSALLKVERPAENTLVLTDADRQAAVFARHPRLPDSMSCREVTVLNRYDLPIDIDIYDSGLVFDGSLLWFTERQKAKLIAVDPETGELATSREVQMTKAPVAHGAEGGDLWRLGAGSLSMAAYRIGPDEDVRDSISGAEIGHPLAIRYLACDPASGTLLIGQGACGGQAFLRIDTRAEPDRLLASAYVAGIGLEAMTCLGPRILAVCRDQPNFVVELDPVTFRAAATWDVFDPTIEVLAIAATGERVFLLGHEPELFRALILEVSL